jgi:hypothetical protein
VENRTIWVPCRGKTAQFGFHAVELFAAQQEMTVSPRQAVQEDFAGFAKISVAERDGGLVG